MRDIDTEELVQPAWDAPPPSHRRLLTQVGASQWEVVKRDLGYATGELALAPDGIRERIRRGNYPRREYIHELIAETYALLMRERIEGRPGQPAWLPDEIYQLISRIGT